VSPPMALFVARPSRGSWTFFALVALAAVTARGYARYERSVVRRDAPLAAHAQDFAACFFGRDAAWLLADDSPAVWEDRFSQWLRATVSVPQPSDWPGRCVPLAEGLVERLQRAAGSSAPLVAAGRDARERLREMSGVRARARRVEAADTEALARPLAALFAGVRNLSLGTRAGWRPTPAHLDRYSRLTLPQNLRLRSVPAEFEGLTLAGGDSLLAFSPRDGRVHRLAIANRGLRDAPLASGVHVGAPQGAVLRAETDQGPAWMLLAAGGGALPMPADFTYEGDPARFTWDAALTDAHLAVAALDHGTARLFVTARDPAAVWSPPLALGEPQAERAVLVAAEGDRWRVTTLHAEASDASLRQHLVRRAATAPFALTAEGPPVVLRERVPSFGHRVATCASGDRRYLAVVEPTHVTVYRVDGASVASARQEAVWPAGYDLALRCDEDRALLSVAPVISRNGHWLFTFDEAADATPLEVPLDGPGAMLRAVELTADAVVAFVSTEGALRSLRRRARSGSAAAWEPGGLVALTYAANGNERTFARLDVSARGDRLALLLRGTYGLRPPRTPQEAQLRATRSPPEPRPEPYVSLLASDDGGMTFWSP
jgi:hypothetical protein